MRNERMRGAWRWLCVAGALAASTAYGATFEAVNENFDGLTLGPAVDENPALGDGTDWTPTAPTNWTIDRTGHTLNLGVTEWDGWTFADKAFWIAVAGDQDRSAFTKASGTVAIADPDEFDDAPTTVLDDGCSGTQRFNSVLQTPVIDVSNAAYTQVAVAFDFDFRHEDTQRAEIRAVWSTGTELLLEFGPGPECPGGPGTTDADSRNKSYFQNLPKPAGATTLRLEWACLNAGNDWWFAVDNIVITLHSGELADDDGDGLTGAQETTLGTDPNDPDTDNDGLDDGREVNDTGTNPLVADMDGDGLLDGAEVDSTGTDPTDADSDDDGLNDKQDIDAGLNPNSPDSDGDGVLDGPELVAGTDGTKVYDYPGAPAIRPLFFEDFDEVATDGELDGMGWLMADTAQVTESGTTWTITNPGGRNNPATERGWGSFGNFMVSDSDAGGGTNPSGTGASHDLTTPSFSTVGVSTVWLHVDTVMQTNNGDTEAFLIEFSTDGGANWTTVVERVSPGRTATPYAATTANAGGYMGRLHVELPGSANQSDVRVRFRHYEPTDGWWFSIDNVLVNDIPELGAGDQVLLPMQTFAGGSLGLMTAVSQAVPPNSGAEIWSTQDKGGRYNPGVPTVQGLSRLMHPEPLNAAPTVLNVAMLDCDADPDPFQDEWLITPVLDATNMSHVRLSFDDETVWASGATQEVLLSLDGGTTWEPIPVFGYQLGAGADNGEDTFYQKRTIHVPAASGEANVVFAFRYVGQDNWWWAVDNISVTALPASADPDGDTLTNDVEETLGTLPNDDDSDHDGLGDNVEVNVEQTDPVTPDTDGDGLSDGAEVNTYSTNPLEVDTDGDGDSDALEVLLGSNPNDPGSMLPATDTGLAAVLMLVLLGGTLLVLRRGRA